MLYIIIKKIRDKFYGMEMKYYKSKFKRCGENVIIDRNCTFYGAENICIGDNVYINANAVFMTTRSTIEIGNNVMFGANVCVVTGDHRIDVVGRRMMEVTEKLPENDRPVKICDDVWIGSNVTILKGVTIGRGSVIGAGSVVTKSVEPYSVCVGNPARIMRKRFDERTIREHEYLLSRC
ncbi:MAG: acetyltransferase [Clostridia bacterium]|nr:acetyltransferase [Clostridia bacterium]